MKLKTPKIGFKREKYFLELDEAEIIEGDIKNSGSA